MQTSKKAVIKNILVPLLTLVFFLAGNAVVGLLLKPLGASRYFADEIDALEKEGKRADLLFLGTSRVFETFVPSVFEEELGMEVVINGGTPTQRPESSYFLLKDLNSRIRPKRVILGVQWNTLLAETGEAQKLESAIMAYDRMSTAGKLAYLPHYVTNGLWPEFLDVYRYRKEFRFDLIAERLAAKREYSRNGYVPDTEAGSYYLEKGFVYSNRHCENGNIPIIDEGQTRFSEAEIDPSKLEYLEKIAAYCRENGIEFSLVASPMAMMNLYHLEGYQAAVDFYERFATEHGISFLNLNYLKGREEFLPDEKMSDFVHLSGEGAEEVSRRYALILAKQLKGEEVSAFFYGDLDGVKTEVERIVSLKAVYEREGDMLTVDIRSLQNEGVMPEYLLEWSADEGKDYVPLGKAGSESHLKLKLPSKEGKLRVSAREAGAESWDAWQEYELKEEEDTEEAVPEE